MRAPLEWLRTFVAVPGDADAVSSRLAACGFEVAGVEAGVIDFEITANRPDCLSIQGLAREASAVFDVDLTAATVGDDEKVRSSAADSARHAPIRVSVGDPGCGRYALAVFDVRVQPSPPWLADRLIAAGVRPINNIVDVSNYVMIELGQPMHAFDAATLSGPEIRVRRARAQESIVTLDGETRRLDDTMLVIADHDRPVAIAGVMGGAATEVSSQTTRIALESAWFQPTTVRATSEKLGLKTEASARFERGADPSAPVHAIRRAQMLLQEIGAGTIAGGITDVYPRAVEARRLSLRRARLHAVLGAPVPDADVTRILTRLGFRLTTSADGWDLEVPSFRVDVSREADAIEEVGRHWGFDRIPPTFPVLRTVPPAPVGSVSRGRQLRRLLAGAGLQEAVTFSFIERAAAAPFLIAGDEPVAIANPLSEKFAVLRPSLLPGLLDAAAYSRRREHDAVRLFEIGAAFARRGEERRIGWMLTGPRTDHWSGGQSPLDFYDASGTAQLIAEAIGAVIVAEATNDLSWAVPGRAARLVAVDGDGLVVGYVGEVHHDVVAARGMPHGAVVVAGEITLDRLAALAGNRPTAIAAPPRHPSIVRDLAIVVSDRLPAADVRATIRRHAPATLAAIREFDRYQGAGVPDGHVSLAVRLTFRDAARTLTDAEVQEAIAGIVEALSREHGALLRGGERQR